MSNLAIPPAQHRRSLRELVVTDRVQNAIRRPPNSFRRLRNQRILSSVPQPSNLHIGCGLNALPGWINLDNNRNAAADLRIDLRGGLRAPKQSVQFAYSEHVIEHIGRSDSEVWLRDLAESMTSNGVVRIATPDLDYVVKRYLQGWKEQSWLSVEPYSSLRGPAEMLNTAMRAWGHTYVYDEEDLTRLLKASGFSSVSRVEWGKSSHAPLNNLERRQDSHLILEASR